MATKLPPQPMGVPPGSSYWNDWYEKLRTFVDLALASVGSGLLVRENGGTLNGPIINSPSIDSPNITTMLSANGLPGESVTVTLAKITGGGFNGSLTFTFGILTSHVDPT